MFNNSHIQFLFKQQPSQHHPVQLWRSLNVLAMFALGLGLSVSPASVHADTYRWVDEKGVVNYSERKPRGVPEDRITTIESSSTASRSSRSQAQSQPPIAQASASDDLSPAQQDMLTRLRDAEQERQQAIAQIKQDNCEKSRKALADLTAKDRVRINMPDGTQKILGEDERQEFISQAQNGIVRNCDS